MLKPRPPSRGLVDRLLDSQMVEMNGPNKISAKQRLKQREIDRKLKQLVNTKSFWQSQTFGPASEVRHIDPSEYVDHESAARRNVR